MNANKRKEEFIERFKSEKEVLSMHPGKIIKEWIKEDEEIGVVILKEKIEENRHQGEKQDCYILKKEGTWKLIATAKGFIDPPQIIIKKLRNGEVELLIKDDDNEVGNKLRFSV